MATPTTAPLADSALCDLLAHEDTRRDAAEELMRRHGRVTLAYARVLCGDGQDAQVLMVETFNRALDVFCGHASPGITWITCLLQEARHLAARWADGGRYTALSPGFVHWLNQRRGDASTSCLAALLGAEAESLLLPALRQLSGHDGTQVWHSLVETLAIDGVPSRHRVQAPAVGLRRELLNAYLRIHNSRARERRCRHLAVRLADAITDGRATTPELTVHLVDCGPCTRAQSDLRAVHHWDVAALQERTLLRPWAAVPRVSVHTAAKPVDPPGPPPAPVGGAPSRAVVAGQEDAARSTAFAGRPGPRRDANARHARTRRKSPAWAAGMGTVTLAVGLTLANAPAEHAEKAAVPPTPSANESATAGPPAQPVGSARPSAVPTGAPTTDVPLTPSSAGSVSGTPSAAVSPSPSVSKGSASPGTLQRGDRGQPVLALQRLLVEAGCQRQDAPLVRGRFDDATAAALMRFQQEARIRGEERTRILYGPATREALERKATRPECR
ncbi:peptidoglycan-binding protein [Streptomyces sp. BE303]|uniref:peptidoglycan-binding protein n=1 Tax=Streptomyces sp. BE303 TaxID=3002528 RepID=UPI002E76DCE6|nr:peptidoglycan-binding protein [Streptomyces sp. BE303]MED7950200.1 hypothetical protein [Streptomyces sp. BE303]